MLKHAPDHLKTQKICDKAIEIEPFLLLCIPDRYKAQEMFKKAIEKYSSKLKHVPIDPRCVKKQLKMFLGG